MSKKTGCINAKIKTSHLIGGAVLCFFGLAAWAGSPTTRQPPVPPGPYHAQCDKYTSGCYLSFDPYVQWDDLSDQWLLTANCSGEPFCATSSLPFSVVGNKNIPPCSPQEISSCNDATLSCGPCPSSSKKKRGVRETGPVKKHPVKKPPRPIEKR